MAGRKSLFLKPLALVIIGAQKGIIYVSGCLPTAPPVVVSWKLIPVPRKEVEEKMDEHTAKRTRGS
jgi:hypothetical protein